MRSLLTREEEEQQVRREPEVPVDRRLELARAVGNQALARMLARQPAEVEENRPPARR